MTFKEFNLHMIKAPVLDRLLPLECRRSYPRLELEEKKLCASFVGFKMRPVQGGVEVQSPSYYLKLRYPNCAVQAFVKLSQRDTVWQAMTPQTPETVKALAELCDKVLTAYDEKKAGLPSILTEYNTLLDKVLEQEQLAVLDRMAEL